MLPQYRPKGTPTSYWKAANDAKLHYVIDQGNMDCSIVPMKQIHKEWPHKNIKSFTTLIFGKLRGSEQVLKAHHIGLALFMH